ncbi:MAG: hypothetical protein QXR42_01440 [Candidatus Bathyarchaeia archaeon]
MGKRIFLTIPDEIHNELTVLSDSYRLDIQKTIMSILEAICNLSRWVIGLKKDYEVPVNLTNVMSHIIYAAFHSSMLFNKILEKMDVKGLYTLGDLEFDLDENSMLFYYDALAGSSLYIDAFGLTIQPGLKTLTTYSHIDIEKLDKQILEKLKHLVNNFELPEEFDCLEDYDIEIEGEEEFWTLKIDCTADSLHSLPSIREISQLVGQLFGRVGIKI